MDVEWYKSYVEYFKANYLWEVKNGRHTNFSNHWWIKEVDHLKKLASWDMDSVNVAFIRINVSCERHVAWVGTNK